MPTDRFYAVDRLDAGFAILMADDGRAFTVEREKLPRDLEEGSVLRAPGDLSRDPDWSGAIVDRVETERCRAHAHELLRELRARDPGGDVSV